jgi:hypothetical protein
MTLTLSDPTALKIVIEARLEQLRGGRPVPSGGRIPRRN